MLRGILDTDFDCQQIQKRFFSIFMIPKQAQHSPQAIFTSFKLERSEYSGPGAPVPGGSSSTLATAEDRLSLADHDGSATDLTPSRYRKRGRVWAPTSSLEQPSKRIVNQPTHFGARSETESRSSRHESLAQVINTPFKNYIFGI